MQNKIEKKFFLCEVITSQFFIVKFSLVRTGYLSSAANVLTGSQCVNKQSQDLARQSENLFPYQLPCQWSINLMKLLWCRFNSIMARLPYCLSMGPLKRDFLDIYLITFRESVIWEIKNLWGWYFFQDLIQTWKMQKKLTKSFFFWDNCISIGIIKFSLLRTGYLSLEAHMVGNSPKSLHANKRDFFELNCLCSNQ